MAYVKKSYFLEQRQKPFSFLIAEFGISMREAQRYIDKGRILIGGEPHLDKSTPIEGAVEVLIYEPSPKGLEPIFETADFAVFDKPSGVLTHPKKRDTEYSLNDEIKSLFGKDANPIHRLDAETSGLIMVSKNKTAERELKKIFEQRGVQKSYLALARGKIESELFIDAPIWQNRDYSEVKLKVYIDDRGKQAQTIIKPVKYFADLDATLVEALPQTGRQHQIRVHLFHVKHPIVGDPIYGVSNQTAIAHLDGELSAEQRVQICGAKRVMLHACSIEFEYKEKYLLSSKIDFVQEIKFLLAL